MHYRPFMIVCVYTAIVTAAMGTPDSVYTMKNDMVAIQAEDLKHNSLWVLEKSHTGYTGSGYLRYNGSAQACFYTNDKGEPVGYDLTGTCQGTQSDRIYIPVYIGTPGNYSVNIYNYMTAIDVDYSIWIHMDEMPLPVKMSHADNPNAWGWLRFGPDYANSEFGSINHAFRIAKAGVYWFYLAGRNKNFCIDRIHIYRKLGVNQFPANYLNQNVAVTPKEPYTKPLATAPSARNRFHGTIATSSCKMVLPDGRLVPQGYRTGGLRIIAGTNNQPIARIVMP